jgi:Carbohydrate binding domain
MRPAGLLVALCTGAIAAGCGSTTPSSTTGLSPVVRPDPANFLLNPGFEDGLSAWHAYPNTAFARTTAEKRFGSASAKATAAGQSPTTFGAYSVGIVGNPSTGSRYVFSVWVRGDRTTKGKRLHIQLNERNPNKSRPIAQANPVLTDRWTRIRIVGVVRGARAVALDVYLLLESGVALGDNFYIDGADLSLARTTE